MIKRIVYIPFFFFKTVQHLLQVRSSTRKDARILPWSLLQSRKKSDTLVILGSGSSINEITPTHWDQFRKFDTIGFNFWPLYNFIPDTYVFETPRDKARYEAFRELNVATAEQYKNTLLIYKDFKFTNDPQLKDRILQQGYYLPFLSVPGSTLPLFNSALTMIRLFNSSGLFRKVNFWKRASVVNLTLLGIKLGYSRIILCGIDLIHSDYFYETDFAMNNLVSKEVVKALIEENLRITDKGSSHKINSKLHGELIAEDLIYAINDHRISRETKLMVYSRSSALSKHLPIYADQ